MSGEKNNKKIILVVGLVILATLAVFIISSYLSDKLTGKVISNNMVELEDSNPYVVVIMIDDLDVRTFEDTLSQGWMPNLSTHILQTGTTFNNSFVATSICCPSRSTFLTGQYSHNNNVRVNEKQSLNGIYLGSCKALNDKSTIATWLENSGYRTGYVGKYLNFYGADILEHPSKWSSDCTNPEYVPPGWNDWQGLIDHTTYNMYGYKINDNGKIITYGNSSQDYQTDVLANRAADFIKESSSSPFFLVINPLAVHTESIYKLDCSLNLWNKNPKSVRAAPRHKGSATALKLSRDNPSFNEDDISDKPAYLKRAPGISVGAPLMEEKHIACLETIYQDRIESLRAVDDLIGKVVNHLINVGVWDKTVVIFTSDNGYLLGEHRLHHKRYPYEESIRVPLIIRHPDYSGKQVTNNFALNTDLAPTIADFTGVTPKLQVDGSSLKPLLDEPELIEWRKRFLLEVWDYKDSFVSFDKNISNLPNSISGYSTSESDSIDSSGNGLRGISKIIFQLINNFFSRSDNSNNSSNIESEENIENDNTTDSINQLRNGDDDFIKSSLSSKSVSGFEFLWWFSPAYTGVRTSIQDKHTPNMAYVEYYKNGLIIASELYDLNKDIHQLDSCSHSSCSKLRKELSMWVQKLKKCRGGTCQTLEFASSLD
jgi:arylsulfatase A-like enzyme